MASFDEIQAQIKALTEQAAAARIKEIETLLPEMKANIAKYGITAEQLGFGSTTSAPALRKLAPASSEAKVLYRNGELTWAGARVGRKPKWVTDAIAAGEDIEKYRVQ